MQRFKFGIILPVGVSHLHQLGYALTDYGVLDETLNSCPPSQFPVQQGSGCSRQKKVGIEITSHRISVQLADVTTRSRFDLIQSLMKMCSLATKLLVLDAYYSETKREWSGEA